MENNIYEVRLSTSTEVEAPDRRKAIERAYASLQEEINAAGGNLFAVFDADIFYASGPDTEDK